jgi:hypothetical protein
VRKANFATYCVPPTPGSRASASKLFSPPPLSGARVPRVSFGGRIDAELKLPADRNELVTKCSDRF